jgi:hypothetical protein
LFVTVGLRYELQAYGDGSIFSYAVAVQDAWAFHWHNISGRLFVYLFCFVPAETYVRLTGDAQGGIVAYGFLFFVAPLLGLAATYAADRSKGRIFFTYACVSTACLCPLVFGFPTEMWMAHALFWPALVLCHYAGRGIVGAAAVFVVLLALVFTHGGALVFAAVILATVALRGMRDPALLRAACALLLVMAVWAYVKETLPPDSYFAGVLPVAALNFIDLSILACPVSVLLLTALAGYGISFLVIARFAPRHAQFYAAAVTAVALAAYWLWFDHALHAENRYYLRTELFVVAPALAVAAAIHALRAEGRLAIPLPLPAQLMAQRAAGPAAQALTGALLLAMLVHAVETEKFVAAWSAYQSAIRQLATGAASDPSLGDPRFVSSDRVAASLKPLSWSSTTQYLSVLMAPGFSPNRLVVDPDEGYYWLTCETATASRLAPRALPARSRELIGADACLHRKRQIVLGRAPIKK